MTTQQLINYYADLLILQYIGKPKAYATIQTVVSGVIMDQLPEDVQEGFNLNATVQSILFSAIPDSGTFILSYGINTTDPIAFNASTEDVQQALSGLLGVGQATVTGSILDKNLIVTFDIQTVPLLLLINANTLTNTATPVTLTIENNTAIGVQLDIIGKYAGVTRNGYTEQGPVILNDADFIKLIQLSIIKNNAGSSLATIVNLLNIYFTGEIFVFDQANTNPMTLVYYINTSTSLSSLLKLFIFEGLLPAPMGVASSIIIAVPNINQLFGFVTYPHPTAVNISPFNTYTDYRTDWPWLSYKNVFA